ncbi:hypothetical protein ROG8370_03160 [Roseovarius gaetbuli]|uniref:Uncharacterized protein n=1 Tax=Roseovarius gaetbuli TaxID=1356575 RepID=A0A1X7A142_9RHOB|nr:hypothetical protein [Roseovarius gaetbuli]SLN67699.1 hypothetical protein ROG8370_03160 [Roseovarius gaetbuli]
MADIGGALEPQNILNPGKTGRARLGAPRDAAVWHEFCRDVIGAHVEGARRFRGSGPSFGADPSAEPAEPDQVFLRSVFT